MSEFLSETERYESGVIPRDIYFDELALDALEKVLNKLPNTSVDNPE